MKRLVILTAAVCLLSGCAYQEAYKQYAVAQSQIATAAGPLVTFHPTGQVASIGNPMTAMAMMNMKAPRSEWEVFMDTIRAAVPFAAIWGTAMGGFDAAKSIGQGTTITGDGNFMGNTAGNSSPSQWASPTTTTELSGEGSIGGPAEIAK